MSSETFHAAKPEAARPAATDFGALPPEINSARLHCGPGAASLRSAATAWAELAAALLAAAGRYRSGATAVHHAHLAWLDSTAEQAWYAAAQAEAAADAYDSALAATTGPAQIAANRARHTALIDRNSLGQHGPAIAETDAQYQRMWVRDAQAMHTYARASADACAVAPFRSPAPAGELAESGGWAPTAASEIASCGQQLISVIPEALRDLSSVRTPFGMALSPATVSLSKLSSLCAPADIAIGRLNSLNKAAAIRQAAALNAITLSISRAARAATAFGRALTVGVLSVPPAWTPNEPPAAQSSTAWGYRSGLHLVND